jgi:4-diphosphocytidyl-2-C-methyl-D-erythritol kinase
VRLEAFAKLNLTLAVGPLRPDGYHEIQSTLCAISLCDTLVLSPRRAGFTLAVDGPCAAGVPRDPSNLVLRAAHALARELGGVPGAAIRLTKRIPHGSGLGGGSSDAAATLRGLLLLWRRRLPRARLVGLAAGLGSDVPFFLGPSPALATGRGERVRTLPAPRRRLVFLIVAPRRAVSTAWAYAGFRAPKSRLTPRKAAAKLLPLRHVRGRPLKLSHNFYNDLEAAVLPRVPEVRAAMAALEASGTGEARMSGSGSAVFAPVAVGFPVSRVVARLRRDGHRVFVGRSVRAGSRTCR